MLARPAADETSALVDQPPFSQKVVVCFTNPKAWLPTAFKIGLGGMGIGAGALYFGPAQTCAATKECGQWLSHLITKDGAVGVFTAGGVDFSAGAVVMGSQSAEGTMKYLANTTTREKVGKTGLLVVVVVSQNVPLLLTSLSTRSAAWQTILTVGGALPSSWFGSIEILQKEIPYFMSQAKTHAMRLYFNAANCYRGLDATEQRQLDKIRHYREQHQLFIENVNAKWRQVVANAHRWPIDNPNYLETLFTSKAQPESSWIASILHQAGNVVGLGLASAFSAGLLANTNGTLDDYVHPIMAIFSTAIVSASLVYANVKWTANGVHSYLDALADTLRGKSIHSALFQLRPATTILANIGSISISALSYAVVDTLFHQQFKVENPEEHPHLETFRQACLYLAIIGIDVYHLASLQHLTHLLVSSLTTDEREKFIFAMEKDIEHYTGLSDEQFIEFAEGLVPAKQIKYGIRPFSSDDVEEVIIRSDSDSDSDNEKDIFEHHKSTVRRSHYDSWLSWCCPKKDPGDDYSDASDSRLHKSGRGDRIASNSGRSFK